MIKTPIYGLSKPEGSDVVDIAVLNKNIDEIENILNLKMELCISETLPAIADRKTNTLYFKVTNMLNTDISNNLKVSPTMGLKIV